jgi:CubicO group peptidase (beta-lactamase class C family)
MTDLPSGGAVAAGFEPVRDVFLEVVAAQPGTGASLAAWHDGEWVLDLYAGWADVDHTRPWTADTLVMPYSVTKPFAATAVLVLAEQGVLDLDAPVQDCWPELRARTTLREMLAHRTGLVVLDDPAPEEAFYDWELMCRLLTEQEPTWEPGTAAGESALFYGHLLGEVVRRVDGRTIGQVLREEVCGPRGLDFHVGLGPGELGRVADLSGFDEEFVRRGEQQTELYQRAIANPPGARDPSVLNSERWRRAEIPAVNGHGTARAVAGLYLALARGTLLGDDMRHQLLTGLGEEPDLVIGDVREWGLGVVVDADGFGMGGVGGSFGWWSEVGGYAFAFLTGHIAGHDRGDRLENAFRAVLGLPPV